MFPAEYFHKQYKPGEYWHPKPVGDPEPRHCCPFWECEYLIFEISDDIHFSCPGPTGGDLTIPTTILLERTAISPDIRTWEFHLEDSGRTTHITVTCRRDQDWFDLGRGPCVHFSLEHEDENQGAHVCFGPVVMDARFCECLDYDFPGDNWVGFSWGQAYVTAEAISQWYATNENQCECEASMDGGESIGGRCLCVLVCPCVGLKKTADVTIDCPDGIGPVNPSPPPPTLPGPPGLGTIEMQIQFYDLDNWPAWADPSLMLSVPHWVGRHDLSGSCYLEFDFGCNPTSAGMSFRMVLHGDEMDPCFDEYVAKFEVCGCPTYEQGEQGCDPFFVEFECGGTATVRIENTP